MCHRQLGYTLIGKVLDKLKNSLEAIVDSPELIHNQKHMMDLMKKNGKQSFRSSKASRLNFIENKKCSISMRRGRQRRIP